MTGSYMVEVLSADEVRLWHVTGNWTTMSTPQRDAASLLVARAIQWRPGHGAARWRLEDSAVAEVLDSPACGGTFTHWGHALHAAVQACTGHAVLGELREQALAAIAAAREAAG